MLLRAKILEKLPATTSGISLARIAVAACSREDPYVTLEITPYHEIITGRNYAAKVISRDKDIIGLSD